MHNVVDPLNVFPCAVYSGMVGSHCVGQAHSYNWFYSGLVTSVNRFKAAPFHIHVTGFTLVIF